MKKTIMMFGLVLTLALLGASAAFAGGDGNGGPQTGKGRAPSARSEMTMQGGDGTGPKGFRVSGIAQGRGGNG